MKHKPENGQASAKAQVATMQEEERVARLLSRHPQIQTLSRYLFEIEDPQDEEFERARYGETKAAVVLTRLCGLSIKDLISDVVSDA